MKKTPLPRTHKALETLLDTARRENFNRGYAEARMQAKEDFKKQYEQCQSEADRTRRDAIQSLSRMGQAIAETAMALSKVIEPRQI